MQWPCPSGVFKCVYLLVPWLNSGASCALAVGGVQYPLQDVLISLA